jgi:hypothetical protein
MSDKAQRLFNIATALREQGPEIARRMGTKPGGLPLWQAYQPLAEALGFEAYSDLRDHFLSLCKSLEADIQCLSLRRESVREEWSSRVRNMQRVFDADKLGQPIGPVFDTCFGPSELSALDAISERLDIEGLTESTEDELKRALDAVREAIEAMERSSDFPAPIARVLKIHLQQIEQAYSHYTDFGDEMFWKTYKESFATFAQIHPIIVKMNNSEEIKTKLNKVWEALTLKTVAGVSVAGNLASIGAFGLSLITG